VKAQWQLQRGGPVARLALGLAAWIRCSRLGNLDDPLAAEIAATHAKVGDDPAEYLPAILSLDAMFPRALAADERLGALLLRYLQILELPDEACVLAAIAVAEDS
jgi:mannitol-1-phosphate/altronate dehydrogenase